MAHVLQVGVGSGGMAALDIIASEPRVRRVTLIDPDTYAAHNVYRHLFPADEVGRSKAALARQWLHRRRPDLQVESLESDLLDPTLQPLFQEIARCADVGVCAADNDTAKFHFDSLLRSARKPWTLGEVLAGGIGGFVHSFVPDGPCFGCVASFLQRSVSAETDRSHDYSQPRGAGRTSLPASRASIAVIASMHAHLTLSFLDGEVKPSTLLVSLAKVEGAFSEPYWTRRFDIPRLPQCLICGGDTSQSSLDVCLAEALGRLRHA